MRPMLARFLEMSSVIQDYFQKSENFFGMRGCGVGLNAVGGRRKPRKQAAFAWI